MGDSDVIGEPFFGAGHDRFVFGIRTRHSAESSPAKGGRADIAQALGRIAPAAVVIHVLGQPAQAGGKYRVSTLRSNQFGKAKRGWTATEDGSSVEWRLSFHDRQRGYSSGGCQRAARKLAFPMSLVASGSKQFRHSSGQRSLQTGHREL